FLFRLPPCSTLFPYTTLFRSRSRILFFILLACFSILLKASNTHLGVIASIRITKYLLCRSWCAGIAQYMKYLSPWKQYSHRESRSEEHTSELQSRENLVCRLL